MWAVSSRRRTISTLRDACQLQVRLENSQQYQGCSEPRDWSVRDAQKATKSANRWIVFPSGAKAFPSPIRISMLIRRTMHRKANRLNRKQSAEGLAVNNHPTSVNAKADLPIPTGRTRDAVKAETLPQSASRSRSTASQEATRSGEPKLSKVQTSC